MFIADFFPTLITLAGGKHAQERPIDGIDMTSMLFEDAPSPRQEIIFDVSGSVRLPTIRQGDYKLIGDMLFNIKDDPAEKYAALQEVSQGFYEHHWRYPTFWLDKVPSLLTTEPW